MKKSNFIIILLSIFFIFGILGCKGTNKNKNKKMELPASTIGVMDVKATNYIPVIESMGRAQPVREVNISVERPGKLLYLPFQVGDVVKKFKLLARVRSLGLWSQHSQAKARISEIKTALKQAKRDYQKMKNLYKSGALSKRELELAETQYNSRLAQFSSAKAGLSQVDENLYGTTVFAPFTGKVAAKYQTEGNFVNMGMPLLRFVDLSTIKVSVGVSELELKHLKEGNVVEITSISYPGTIIKGAIQFISPVADLQTGAYPVEVRFKNVPLSEIKAGVINRVPINEEKEENPDKGGNYWAFKGGMILTVKFFQKPIHGIFVPAESIIERKNKKWVVTVNKSCLDGKTETKTSLLEVIQGKPINEWFLIKRGLTEGTIVAISGHTKLRRGSKVLCVQSNVKLGDDIIPQINKKITQISVGKNLKNKLNSENLKNKKSHKNKGMGK